MNLQAVAGTNDNKDEEDDPVDVVDALADGDDDHGDDVMT